MDALESQRVPSAARRARPIEENTRRFRFSIRQILVSLIILFLAGPFVESRWGRLAETVLYSFVLISTLVAVGARPRALMLSLALILPALTFRWVSHLFSLSQNDPLPLVCLSLAFGFTIFQLLRFVIRAQRVDSDVLCAGISVYLLLGQIWGFLYQLADRFLPGSFNFPGLPGHSAQLSPDEAFYFSMSTITTAGYGDIVPASRAARTLSNFESTTGVLFMAVLLSRLVAMHLADRTRSQQSMDGIKPSA
jgi:hypothetical protein